MSKEMTPKEAFKAKVRRAHKVYTNEDGVQMCEMEFRKYLVMEQALTELTELKRDVQPYRTAHEKLIEMGLRLKVTKNYADGVFSHEWWNENDDRVIVFYIDEKVTTVYEGNNEIMAIIPQYLEELK